MGATQRECVRWRPGNVTLFGESYGALSTSAHLTSPASDGLFDKAIIQSGFALSDVPAGAMFPGVPALPWYGWRASAEVEGLGTMVAQQVGCNDPTSALECLRRVPIQDLLALAQPFQPFAFGNTILPVVPADALREGRFHRGPDHERRDPGRTPAHRGAVPRTRGPAGHCGAIPRLLEEAFGDDAPAVQMRYPLSDYESASVAWASVLTDRMWARPTFEQHGLLGEHVPTFAYEFADRHAPMYLPFPEDLSPGAFHAAEVPYLFDDEKFAAGSTPDQRRLSAQ